MYASTAVLHAENRTAFKSTALLDRHVEDYDDVLIVAVRPTEFAEECESLIDWNAGIVHEIPLVCGLKEALRRCTTNGKVVWRLEDKQVASILVDGWFEPFPNVLNVRNDMQSILVGSPGVGKSTLICLMTFYLVLNHKRNVLLYWQLDRRYCLLYLGLDDDRIVYFSVENCDEDQTVRIYKSLKQKQELWLLLDGFRCKREIPQQLMAFNMLGTSQQVDLKSRLDVYCCLLPCWSKMDLLLLGSLVFDYTADEMAERYYYSGGSVREFALTSVKQMTSNIHNAISMIEDAVHRLSYRSTFLSRLFVKNVNDWNHFKRFCCREVVIDSKYVVRHLCVRICATDLHRTMEWPAVSHWPKSFPDVLASFSSELAGPLDL